MTRRCKAIVTIACRSIAMAGRRLPPGGVLFCQEQERNLLRLERRLERCALEGDAVQCRRIALAWYAAWREAIMVHGEQAGRAAALLYDAEQRMRSEQ